MRDNKFIVSQCDQVHITNMLPSKLKYQQEAQILSDTRELKPTEKEALRKMIEF